MSLVSGLYKLAPSEWSGSDDERRVKNRACLRNLVTKLGREEVETRLKVYVPVNADEALMVAWMRLEVMK